MSGEPTLDDVRNAFQQARDDATARQDLVEHLPAYIAVVAADAGRRAGDRRARIVAVGVLALAALLGFTAGVAGISTARDAVDRADAAAITATTTRQQVDAALEKLDEANRDLQARGQVPVAPPSDPDPAGAIGAAVLAQVLAQLPPAPTAAEVAERIVPAVTANVLGPTRSELSRQVADYLAANPPPRGDKGDMGERGEKGDPGDRGEPGPPPTREEIEAAVANYLTANPPPPGPQGVGVTDVAAEVRDGTCYLIFTLTDPRTGTSSEDAVATPDAVCTDGLLLGPNPP